MRGGWGGGEELQVEGLQILTGCSPLITFCFQLFDADAAADDV